MTIDVDAVQNWESVLLYCIYQKDNPFYVLCKYDNPLNFSEANVILKIGI